MTPGTSRRGSGGSPGGGRAADGGAPPPRVPRRKRRIAGAILLFLLAVIVAAFGLRGRLDGWVQTALERNVSERLGGQLRLGALSLHLGRLEAQFSDVQLQVPAGEAGDVRVTVVGGRCRVKARSVLGLLTGRLRLADLSLDRPFVEWNRRRSAGRLRGGARATPVLDLRIDRLEVRDGKLLYAERTIPFELTADAVTLTAEWDARARALVGQASLRMGILRPPLAHPLDLALASRFHLRPYDVELIDLEAEGDGIRGSLDATVQLLDPVSLVGRGAAQVDLDRVRPLLASDLPPIGGRVEGTFGVESGPEPTTLRGRFHVLEPRFGSLRAAAMDTTASYMPGRLELAAMEAHAFEGKVTGSIEVNWADQDRFRVDLAGRGLEASALFRQIGLGLPTAGRVDGQTAIEGAPVDRRTWNGSGTFTARATPPERGNVPVDGTGRFDIVEGQIVVDASVDIASARLGVSVASDLRTPGEVQLDLEGTTTNARDTQLAVQRFLDALELEAPELARRRLGGAGRVRTSIRAGRAPQLRLELDLAQGRYGRRRFDRAQVELALEGDRLHIPSFKLTSGAQRASGSARILISPLAVDELDAVASNLQPGWLLAALGLPQEVTGLLTTELSVRQTDLGRVGSGRFSVVDGHLFGEPFDRLAGDLTVRADAANIENLTIAGPVARGEGAVTWSTSRNEWLLALTDTEVDLGQLGVVRSSGLPIEGRLDLRGTVSATTEGLDGALDLAGRDWTYSGRSVGDATGQATFDAGRLRVRLDGDGEEWSTQVDVALRDDLPLHATIELNETLFEFGEGDPAPVWARVTGEAAVHGPGRDPSRLQALGTISSAEIHTWGASVTTNGELTVRLDGGQLTTSPLRLVGPGTDVQIESTYDIEADRVHARASGLIDLGLLTAALPEVRARGGVRVDVVAEGALAGPSFEGSLEGQNGRLRWLGFPQSVDELLFRVELDGRRASLQGLRGRFGNGEIRAEGRATLGGIALESFLVELEAANVRVAYPEGFRGIYEGRVSLESLDDHLKLAGNLTLLLGVYDKDFDLTGQTARPYAVPDDSRLPENVQLDLRVVADGNTWVKNDLATVESSFELHIGGSLRRPEVTGRLWMLEGGKLVYRDVEYRLTSGSLDFVELDRLNPYLTLRAETEVREYTVFLRVEGTLERFEYELTSDPVLSTQDIIALLATGSTFEEITGKSGGGAPFTGDLAANYFTGALTGPFEKQIERLLGLEKVRIDPLLAQGESDPTTRLTLGEEVADDLWVVFSADLTRNERQLYQVDWGATRGVRLSVQRDTQGGVGGDVRYTKRFWFDPPPQTSETSVQIEGPDAWKGRASSVVASVHIEGAEANDRNELRQLVRLRAGDDFSRSEMFSGLERIKRFYVRRKRIETRVDATAVEGAGGANVVYQIAPGPPVELAFVGTTRKEERRLRASLEQLWIESVFADEVYDDAEARVREFFHARGHYAVDVRHEVHGDDRSRTLTFSVDRGKPVRVDRVAIKGADRVSDERIQSQMLTRESTLFSRRLLVPRVLDEDVAAIRSLYRSEGFLRVEIGDPRVLLSMSADSAGVEIEIEEGPRFTIAGLAFPATAPFTTAELSHWTGLEVGQVFSPAELLQAESRLRAGIDERGYPDARVRGRFRIADEGVHVRFEIDPGERKRVGDIRIVGNHLTHDNVIRRELHLESGDDISREELLRSQHRLYQLGIFRNVRLEYTPMRSEDPDLQRLEVRVEEAAPLSTSVGLGYDTEADARISFSLTHDNLGGHDRVLSVQGKFSGLEQRLQLVGKEPRLFRRKIPGLLSLGWSEEDQEGFTEQRVTTALRVDKSLTPRWTALLRHSLQRVDLSEVEITPEELEEEKLVEGRLGDVGLTFVRESRDNPFLPRRGAYLALGTRVFAKVLASEFTFVKNDVTWSMVRPLGTRTALASAIRGGVAFPYGGDGTVPISEAYFAGGDSTLRGFPRDEVGPASGGEAMLLFNEELRFPIWHSLKGVLFYDAGNVWESPSDADPTDLRHVLGTGLRYETPIGPLRLEYGHKLDRESGESAGELFLAIGSAF